MNEDDTFRRLQRITFDEVLNNLGTYQTFDQALRAGISNGVLHRDLIIYGQEFKYLRDLITETGWNIEEFYNECEKRYSNG